MTVMVNQVMKAEIAVQCNNTCLTTLMVKLIMTQTARYASCSCMHDGMSINKLVKQNDRE